MGRKPKKYPKEGEKKSMKELTKDYVEFTGRSNEKNEKAKEILFKNLLKGNNIKHHFTYTTDSI